MAKFNRLRFRSATGRSPVVTDQTPTGTTFEGAPGYARPAQSELFVLAVSNMVGEDTFYERGGQRDDRYSQLVHEVAVDDPDWLGRFLRWLRSDANMRSASLVGALEAAKAMVAASLPGSRQLVASVLQRPDEPGEALAYWMSRYGRSVPKPVKRGVADAVVRLYTERALLKYDTASKGFRFGDVIDLVHPVAATPEQGLLFRYALERRHNRPDEIPAELATVRANAELRAVAQEHPAALLDADRLRAAGMTWEDVLSLAGSKVDKRQLWESLIPSMGFMSQLRNLRNFDESGVSDRVAATVAARLADPEQVAKSRQFPFRFLAAYRSVNSVRWAHALDRGLTASLANIPELPGRTLVLVDRSGSMFYALSKQSQLTFADAAAIFGAGLAVRNHGRVDLVQYGTSSSAVQVKRGDSLLKVLDRFDNFGGTETAKAVRKHFNGHDRVILVTDEQAWAGSGNPGDELPATTPLYTWNLVGYRYGQDRGAVPNRHVFAGLNDQAFRLVPLLERGTDAGWPF